MEQSNQYDSETGSKVRFEFKDHFTLVEERKRMAERYVAGYYLLSEFNVA